MLIMAVKEECNPNLGRRKLQLEAEIRLLEAKTTQGKSFAMLCAPLTYGASVLAVKAIEAVGDTLMAWKQQELDAINDDAYNLGERKESERNKMREAQEEAEKCRARLQEAER